VLRESTAAQTTDFLGPGDCFASDTPLVVPYERLSVNGTPKPGDQLATTMDSDLAENRL
jgi:hypothetical protein